jgi:hypothetical protein
VFHRRTALALSFVAIVLFGQDAFAETDASRFGAGGYMRVMTRPDFQGGNSRLGFWNLYGRLLNEGPYASLELRLDVIPRDPLTPSPWTSVHARVEGGSVQNADPGGGSLDNFRLSQLYARTGNILLENVTWQIGTLESYWGDLGLYDMRPAQILFETLGLSSRVDLDQLEVLLGVGDAGYFIKGTEYNTVLTVGGSVKVRFGKHAEVGVGGEYHYEPKVEGNRFAPHNSRFEDGSGIDYENFVRGEVAETFFDEGGQPNDFPDPVATDANSFKLIGHIGFGNLGPLVWNNLFANFLRRHPDNFVFENYMGEEYRIYVKDLTDERYQLNIGNEMQLELVPDILDLTWAVLYGLHYDNDNFIKPTDNDRRFMSAVARFQVYLTESLHFLLESSVAQEQSTNGNMYRNHADSIFQSEDGRMNTEGLEFGDADTRNTVQLKLGPVLQPTGRGIFNRPSFRLLYGLQHSSQNNAFGNSFVQTQDEFDDFDVVEQHYHHVIALEVETWF